MGIDRKEEMTIFPEMQGLEKKMKLEIENLNLHIQSGTIKLSP